MEEEDLILERPWLSDYQRAFLYNPHRFTVTEAATKIGKTLSHSWWLFELAHAPSMQGDEYLWLAPTHAQAEMVFNDVARKVAETGAYRINRSALTIETPEGGILRYKTAEIPDNLYGPSNIEAIVGDEFTRWRPLVWPVVRSLATARRCPVKLIGNYIGEHNWGHRLAVENQADPDWAYFRIDAFAAVAAGIMSGEEVESARRSLPAEMFAALYLCKGTSDPAALMSWQAINNLFTNDHVPKGTKAITADVARYGSDLTVILVWEGLRVVHATVMDKSSIPQTAAAITSLCVTEGVQRSNVVIDDDGIGGGVVDLIPGCLPFKGGSKPIDVAGQQQYYANLKAQCTYLLAEHVNEGEVLWMPEEHRDKVVEELSWMKRDKMDTDQKLRILPKEKVKEGIGRSPDFGDALMMRMALELTPDYATFERAIDNVFHRERREGFRRWVEDQFPSLHP
jgi:hypothetical protein